MSVNTRPLDRHISPHTSRSSSSSAAAAAAAAAASFLTTFSKVSKFITHDHMLHYFKHNLNPIQTWFLKIPILNSYSGDLSLFYFSSSFKVKYSIYFDLNSAFDLVSHPILLHKLCKHGL